MRPESLLARGKTVFLERVLQPAPHPAQLVHVAFDRGGNDAPPRPERQQLSIDLKPEWNKVCACALDRGGRGIGLDGADLPEKRQRQMQVLDRDPAKQWFIGQPAEDASQALARAGVGRYRDESPDHGLAPVKSERSIA